MKKTASRAKRKLKKAKLTEHQLRVIKAATDARLAGKSLRSAAQQVWPNQSPEAAGTSMSRVLRSADVNETWRELMAEQGITPEDVIGAVRDGLTATKPLELRYYVEDSDAEVDESDEDLHGEKPIKVLTKHKQVPDHSIRINAARTAAQWMGVGKKQEGAGEQPPGTIVVNQHFNTDGKAKKYVSNSG